MLMRLKIYQIDPEKDPERVRFLALKNVDKVDPKHSMQKQKYRISKKRS